ncbi:unnamed protein product [Medioppia subpectinata]|uniref:Uncharacterized protein n=1 Tax=Medioppia subpectinata TaxID=1979941 RepID=A0A7R9QIL0_9ACAR|nr:unnamed protein product [Medioppia subpectinata]CAG2121451.1 unnamed protein product [Medioppia subpectinata]
MASSLSAMAYALGGCILPLVVYITGHWVLLAVFQFAITIPIIIFWRYIPESASWLITQKRTTETDIDFNAVNSG